MEHTDLPSRTSGNVSSKLAGALIGAIAALSIGGVGFAFAQEAETPTTEAPAAETPATPETPADEDCPDKAGGAGGGGGGSDTAESTDTDSGAEV